MSSLSRLKISAMLSCRCENEEGSTLPTRGYVIPVGQTGFCRAVSATTSLIEVMAESLLNVSIKIYTSFCFIYTFTT